MIFYCKIRGDKNQITVDGSVWIVPFTYNSFLDLDPSRSND